MTWRFWGAKWGRVLAGCGLMRACSGGRGVAVTLRGRVPRASRLCCCRPAVVLPLSVGRCDKRVCPPPLYLSRLSPQPHRVRMAHNLIVNYGLYRDLEVFVRAPPTDLRFCRTQVPPPRLHRAWCGTVRARWTWGCGLGCLGGGCSAPHTRFFSTHLLLSPPPPPPRQRPALIDHTEMTHFHADDYINFLRVITPDNMHPPLRQLQRCG